MRNNSAFLAAAAGAILLNVMLLAAPAAAESDLPWTTPPANAVELLVDTASDVAVSDVTATVTGETGDLPWTR